MQATFKSYPSNLTTAQWVLIFPYIPDAKPGGRPRSTDIFLVVQAIDYVLCSGCSWRMLPDDFPKWQTVYHYFRQWRISGLWQRLNRILREQLRLSLKRCTTPSAAIVDSQSIEIGVLTTHACGIDGDKCVKGRKRHVLVDTLGLVIFVVVTAANVADYSRAHRLLQKVDKREFPRLFLFWADGGYRADSFIRWVMDTFRWV